MCATWTASHTLFGSDPIQFVISANEMRRHDNESQRTMAAARLANLKEGRPSANNSANLQSISQSDAAETMGVSTRSVATAAKVQATAARAPAPTKALCCSQARRTPTPVLPASPTPRQAATRHEARRLTRRGLISE